MRMTVTIHRNMYLKLMWYCFRSWLWNDPAFRVHNMEVSLGRDM